MPAAAVKATMSSVALRLRAPLTRADLPGLCARVRGVVCCSCGETIVCDVGELADADAVTVDALARIAVIARRHGRQLAVRGASPALCELVALMGLADVLALER